MVTVQYEKAYKFKCLHHRSVKAFREFLGRGRGRERGGGSERGRGGDTERKGGRERGEGERERERRETIEKYKRSVPVLKNRILIKNKMHIDPTVETCIK